MVSLIRNPTFRRLYTAQVVALTGTGLLTVALALLAYDLAGAQAGQVLGTALAIKMVAYVAMAPVMRAAVARCSPVAVLVSADAVRMLMAFALPWVHEVWLVYLLVFALQSASATFTPTVTATIPAVLPDQDDYTRAQSAYRIAYQLESVASPMIAAALLTVMAPSMLFVGTALGFAASAVLVMASGLRREHLPSVPDLGFRRRVTQGMHIMLSHKVFRGILAANGATAAATALVVVSSVTYVRGTLGSGDSALAVAYAAFGAGAILTAIALPAILRRHRCETAVVTGAAICTAGLAATGVLLIVGANLVALLMVWVVLGVGTACIDTATPRILRDHAEPDRRDAVFSAQFSLSHAAFLITYPLAGWAPDLIGTAATPLLLAVIACGCGYAAHRIWRTPWPTMVDTRM